MGLKLFPFLDAGTVEEMERIGKFLKPKDFPQVLVCARETATMNDKLGRMQWHLFRAGSATLLTIWLSILAITMWTMKPIRKLERRFQERAKDDSGPLPEIPDHLPVELRGLAEAFNRTLKRAEAARDRERDFAMHAAHELRTPIAGIQATLEQALLRERPADDLRDRIGNALLVTEGMRGTIQSLMKLARVRGRIEKVEIAAFDPGTLVNEMIETQRPRFEDRKLELSVDIGESIDGFLSDARLLKIVVATLLDNVVRHAPGGTRAEVRMEAEDRGFVLRITHGFHDLKAEDVPRLFEPFQRGEQAGEEGAGLGLSLAKEIAELLGGTLKMDLEGDRVTVELRVPSLVN